MSSKSISDLTRPLCGRIGSLVFICIIFFSYPHTIQALYSQSYSARARRRDVCPDWIDRLADTATAQCEGQ